jgi:hypothetical protein
MSTSGQKEPPLYTIYIYINNTIYYLSCLYVSISCAFFFTVVRIISCLIHTISYFTLILMIGAQTLGPRPREIQLHGHCTRIAKAKATRTAPLFSRASRGPVSSSNRRRWCSWCPARSKGWQRHSIWRRGGCFNWRFFGCRSHGFMVSTFARSWDATGMYPFHPISSIHGWFRR